MGQIRGAQTGLTSRALEQTACTSPFTQTHLQSAFALLTTTQLQITRARTDSFFIFFPAHCCSKSIGARKTVGVSIDSRYDRPIPVLGLLAGGPGHDVHTFVFLRVPRPSLLLARAGVVARLSPVTVLLEPPPSPRRGCVR
jgi:hypothetical protein